MLSLLAVARLVLQAPESLESLEVKSAEDVAACYALKPYVLEKKGGAANTRHLVDANDIQLGCTAKAVELARARSGEPQLLTALAEEVRKGHRAEAALKVFRVLVEHDKSKASCDDSGLFNAVLSGLSHPADYPSKADSDVASALAVVDACLWLPQFKEDIRDEVKPEKKRAYLTDHLCGFLKAKKVVAGCP